MGYQERPGQISGSEFGSVFQAPSGGEAIPSIGSALVQAAQYAADAAASAAAAQTAETNAETAETNAETAETNAETAAAAAAVSAAAALVSENNAETAETNAETAETNAEAAQAAAEAARDAAITARNAAQLAETNAETAETNAELAEVNAEAALDEFTDLYLGAKAADPTLDNDGDALQDGALYWNTVGLDFRVYDLGTTTWISITSGGGSVPTSRQIIAGTNLDGGGTLASDVTIDLAASISLTDVTTSGTLTSNGSTVIGNASGDALTIAPSAVTWSNNPTHSGSHTFASNVVVNGNLVVDGSTTLGNASADSLFIRPAAVTWSNNPTHSSNHTFSGNVTVSGVLSISDGTSSLPGLAFGTDPDNGIYRPSANVLAVCMNNVESARFGSGSLSIKTTIATAALVVDAQAATSTAPTPATGTIASFLRNGSGASATASVSVVSGNTGIAQYSFGDTDTDAQGWVRYNHATDLMQFGAVNARFQFHPTVTAPTAVAQDMGGIELLGGGMNTTNKFTNALKFGSTDSDFTTVNPKFGALIVGEATQTYNSDTLGGMAMVFFTQPNSPGAAGNLVERIRIEPTGSVVINDSDSGATLTVGGSNGNSAILTSSSAAGGVILWHLENTDNTSGSSHTRLDIHVGGTSGGDPYIWFHNQSSSVSMGMDNSDSDAFVWSESSVVGTSNLMKLSLSGHSLSIADSAGTMIDVGYLGLPQNAQTANYTGVIADAGKHIYYSSGHGAGDTFTIPANASVAYPIGTTLTIINGDGTNTLAIAITTDTLRLAGTSSTGTRTLGIYGVATAVKVTSTVWIISGSGLT